MVKISYLLTLWFLVHFSVQKNKNSTLPNNHTEKLSGKLKDIFELVHLFGFRAVVRFSNPGVLAVMWWA